MCAGNVQLRDKMFIKCCSEFQEEISAVDDDDEHNNEVMEYQLYIIT